MQKTDQDLKKLLHDLKLPMPGGVQAGSNRIGRFGGDRNISPWMCGSSAPGSRCTPGRRSSTAFTGARHETVNHSAKEYVRFGTDIHSNSIESAFSLLKRGIIGSWHKVSAKHLQAYPDEMTFRFDRRKRSDLFIDTLRHMVTADPLTFDELTAA